MRHAWPLVQCMIDIEFAVLAAKIYIHSYT